MILRALLGALAAGIITALARRLGTLSEGGQWAAFGCGTLAAAAGWDWAALLVAFFVTSAALTRWGREVKRARISAVVRADDERKAVQVLANGGVFVILALAAHRYPEPEWTLAAAGALAAATADTWATEVGTFLGGTPRSIATGRSIAPGLSGGVTLAGVAAGLAGAVGLGALSQVLIAPFWQGLALSAAIGGFAGSVIDSLLGATVQEMRWCPTCEAWSERRVHTCSGRTVPKRGFRWITNDVVNLAATAAGAAIAVVVWPVVSAHR